MKRMGWGIGLATLVALVAGVGLASRATRVGAWDIDEPEWWGDVPYVAGPERV